MLLKLNNGDLNVINRVTIIILAGYGQASLGSPCGGCNAVDPAQPRAHGQDAAAEWGQIHESEQGRQSP